MRNLKIIAGITFIAIASGCLPSLHPLYTNLDLISNPTLTGTWTNDAGNEIWQFTQGQDKAYELMYMEDSVAAEFTAHLLQLDSLIYLDTYPHEDFNNDFYELHLVPAHIFGKVRINGDSLHLALLDSGWLRDMMTKGEIYIAHEDIESGVLLTASTADLQRLVRTYANDPKAFASETDLVRKK